VARPPLLTHWLRVLNRPAPQARFADSAAQRIPGSWGPVANETLEVSGVRAECAAVDAFGSRRHELRDGAGKVKFDERLDVLLDIDGYVRDGGAVDLAQGGGDFSE
jgi:hypothetical protein